MRDWLAAGVFVVGFMAWALGVGALATWWVMATGTENVAVNITALALSAVLVWAGFFTGLRLLVGRWF